MAAIEALKWIGGPLSATELHLVLERYPYQTVAHHIKVLADSECIEQTGSRQARGSAEKYYALSAAPKR